ncbi:MAG: lysylphosphatidylglycerol synthase domain-containing protein [Proteobacteria bacterium]|nr:lysylphosphatidylglycerol synthase domain-containing protein [Pseudomonadota bacterium]
MADTTARNSFIKALFIAALAVCLCLAALFVINSYASIDVEVFIDNRLLIPAVVIQVIAILLFIQAWKFLLSAQGEFQYSFLESTSHIGVTLMGKYLPGKIWGLVGRAFLLIRRGHSKSDAVNLLIADQFLTFYSGIGVGTIALLAYFNPLASIALLLVTIVSAPFVIGSYDAIIQKILDWSKLFLHRLSESVDPQVTTIDKKSICMSLIAYVLHWILIALVLCLLFYPLLAAEPFQNSLLLMAAIPLAMLSGFIALWAPGGIGVREGVIVLILTLNLTVDVALSIAISYRLICVLNDLSTGSATLYYFSRIDPSLLEE